MAKKLRENNIYGGVAIFCKGNAKRRELTQFKVKDLEACWCDIMVDGERLVVGSVYINVGKLNEIDIFESVLKDVTKAHKKVIVCLDANSRSLLWDPSCVKLNRSSQSRKMGERFEQIIIDHSLSVLNNGNLTYYLGEVSSAVDISLSFGLNQMDSMKWNTIEDMLQTPHKGIIIEYGDKADFIKRKTIDWKKFDWSEYERTSKVCLHDLIKKWEKDDSTIEEKVEEVKNLLLSLIQKIAQYKTVTNHSRPWISCEMKAMLEELHKARDKARHHRSQRNIAKFKEMMEKVTNELDKAYEEHLINECEKLDSLSDSQKWKAIGRLLNHENWSTVQPIKVKDEYVFEDERIFKRNGRLPC